MRISETENYSTAGFGYNQKKDKAQNFNGGFTDGAFKVLDDCFVKIDKHPMIQVSLIDLTATTLPRTWVDLKTSLAAALETFRREVSGLVVNCLTLGAVVKGIATILPKNDELKDTNVAKSWANENAITKFKEVYKNAHKSGVTNPEREYVKTALDSITGLDGNTKVDYSKKSSAPEFNSAIDDVTKAIYKEGKDRNALLKSAREKIVKVTKAESILEFNGKPSANLEETLRDISDLGSQFGKVKEKTAKKLGKSVSQLTSEELSGAIDKYAVALKDFVNKKSFIGLGIVCAIALSMQSINRAITRKQFNAQGAPIYKDFGKKDTTKKMDEKQKKEFFVKRLLAAGSMFGLAALSMMKKPTKKMFQSSGIFPTLDQCRWIAALTFASRMFVAEDENELRETTIRDEASFAGLYFLGDYAKKGAASMIEAFSKTKSGKKLMGDEDIVLLNRKNPPQEKTSNWQQFKDWIKNTELKSANEVSSKKILNLRNLCRVADIAFSISILGIFLPLYNRKVTERKVEEAKRTEEIQKKSMKDFLKEENTPSIFKNIAA